MVLGIPGPDWSASPSAGRVGPAPFRVGITSRENQPQGRTSIKREGIEGIKWWLEGSFQSVR